jgi:hypothetical protein
MPGEDRDPVEADRMSAFERRSRLLLRAYPATYRRERAEEIIGTLLEARPEGRAWPRLPDARTLAVGGLKARAAQNRRLTTAANLRIAVLVGVAIYVSEQAAGDLGGVVTGLGPLSVPGWSPWPAALAGLLIAATVLFAWTARRIVLLVSALSAAAAVTFVLAQAGAVEPAIMQMMCLAAVVALASGRTRPSRNWLWLIGAIALAVLSSSLNLGYGPLLSVERLLPLMLLFAIGVISIVWVAVDARPAIAFVTYFTIAVLQSEASSFANGAGVYVAFPVLLIVPAIAAPAVWLLRRQSA